MPLALLPVQMEGLPLELSFERNAANQMRRNGRPDDDNTCDGTGVYRVRHSIQILSVR